MCGFWISNRCHISATSSVSKLLKTYRLLTKKLAPTCWRAVSKLLASRLENSAVSTICGVQAKEKSHLKRGGIWWRLLCKAILCFTISSFCVIIECKRVETKDFMTPHQRYRSRSHRDRVQQSPPKGHQYPPVGRVHYHLIASGLLGRVVAGGGQADAVVRPSR